MGESERHVGLVVRAIRRAKGLSQGKLAEMAGVHLNTVSRFEANPGGSEHGTLAKLAAALGENSSRLMVFTEMLRPDGQLPTPLLLMLAGDNRPGAAELLRRASQAARGVEAEREDVDTYDGYKRDNLPVVVEGEASPQGNLFWNVEEGKPLIEADEWMSRPGDVTDPRAYGVRVRGDSMVPAFYPGMRLIVSPNRRVRSGDRVYVELHNGERLVKVARKERAGWILESLNPAYPPRFIQEEEVGTMHKIVYAREL